MTTSKGLVSQAQEGNAHEDTLAYSYNLAISLVGGSTCS
jgi:hypothetical protein